MSSHPQAICVSFDECADGWIYFTVSRGSQSVRLRASYVFDPFPDLVAWLEAITVDVQYCGFEMDEEGTDKKFTLSRIGYDHYNLTISDCGASPEVYLSGDVDPAQLVEEFYSKLKLRIFGQSQAYKKDMWELETLEERLVQYTGLVESGRTVKEALQSLSRAELMAFLFKVAPHYMVSFPDAKDKGEELVRFAEHVLESDNPDKRKWMVETPQEWNIPVDYDTLSLRKKGIIVQECLDEQVSGYQGSKLGEIRSAIVENWLERRR